MKKQMTVKQFVKDVASHALTIKHDDGVYRHVCFRQPGQYSWNMWFDLITWPQCLTINSDMGTWTFARVPDMFTFFRSIADLKINPHYWLEKILSENRFGGPARHFSPDKFKIAVLSHLDECELPEDHKKAVTEELEEEVFGTEDESEARRQLADFEHYLSPGVAGKFDKFVFTDTWEIDGKDYSYHYLWCCYAIVWGIQQYDAAKELHAQKA